jgi:hypothetical protein
MSSSVLLDNSGGEGIICIRRGSSSIPYLFVPRVIGMTASKDRVVLASHRQI